MSGGMGLFLSLPTLSRKSYSQVIPVVQSASGEAAAQEQPTRPQ